MNRRSGTALVLCLLCLGLFAVVLPTQAATPVAKMTQFKGEVVIVSEARLSKVTSVGQPINDGDTVQTRNGEAQITFNDGALMTIRPYTSTVIQEGEEEKGWFLFKAKELVRRITCQVGNLWFKSGASAKKNYLQSPTAVCGLRGSVTEWGYDNVMTYMSQTEGGSDLMGPVQKVTEDFFKGLQANAQQYAGQNPVYNKFDDSYNKTEQANRTGTALDKAAATVAVLEAVKLSIESILKNPYLPPDVLDILNSTLRKANSDLKDAQNHLNSVTGQPETVMTPTSTTETTTTTTTEAPTTSTTLSISTTTTSTSITTTTTSSPSPTYPGQVEAR